MVEVIDANTGMHRTTVNIEKAAKLCVKEGPLRFHLTRRTVQIDRPLAKATQPMRARHEEGQGPPAAVRAASSLHARQSGMEGHVSRREEPVRH